MKTNALTEKRKSQVFVTAIIVLAIVLSLGAALLFHSRSLRDVTRLQVDTERAYSLAKSGIGIGETLISSTGPCGSHNIPVHKKYGMGGGKITINIVPAEGTLTSTGDTGKSIRVLEKTFKPYTGEIQLTDWAKVYEIDGSYYASSFKDCKPTPDGGYVILGEVPLGVNYDFFLIKTDAKGEIKWAKTGGSSAWNEHPKFILPITDGYIIGGTTPAPVLDDFFLIKTDNQGDLQWEKIYAAPGQSETFASLQQDSSSGGYLIVGNSLLQTDCIVIKTDTNGNKLWGNRYAGTSNDTCSCGQEINGSYLVGGQRFSFPSSGCFFAKLNSSGGYDNVSKNWGNALSDKVLAIQQSSDAKYVFAGSTGFVNSDFYLLKTNTDGTSGGLSKTYGSSATDTFATFQCTAAGGYLLGGTTQLASSTKGQDFLLVKTDDQGQLQWAKTYGGDGDEQDLFLIQESADGYILGGTTKSWMSGSTADFLLIKTDAQGDLSCCSDFATDVTTNISSNNAFTTSDMTWGNAAQSGYNASNYTDTSPGNYTSNTLFVCPEY